ncbi:MAG: HD domain-containing protein [Patescibacteria group bacterium]|jgi:(p)ppGpp synthase/HD superfamily hydrolase
MEKNSREEELLEEIMVGIRKEVEIGKRFGFDPIKHFQETLAVIEAENAEENEDVKILDAGAQDMADNLNRNVCRDHCVLSDFVRRAIEFAIQVHEIDQKQKRKGKNIPYIVHPLTVGLILAKAGAPDHVIVAGILHDVVEDSIPEKKVTLELVREQFGPSVADMVRDVTEEDKSLSWQERKLQARKHIATMELPSLWVKTGDVVSNLSEILSDYKKDGDVMFQRFNAPKEAVIENYRALLDSMLLRWGEDSENPLVMDLRTLASNLADL